MCISRMFLVSRYVKDLTELQSQRETNNEQPETRNDIRFIDGIKEALHQSMIKHPNLIIMGQDIAEYGGAFKITEGFVAGIW